MLASVQNAVQKPLQTLQAKAKHENAFQGIYGFIATVLLQWLRVGSMNT
jgi:hypothetical protein